MVIEGLKQFKINISMIHLIYIYFIINAVLFGITLDDLARNSKKHWWQSTLIALFGICWVIILLLKEILLWVWDKLYAYVDLFFWIWFHYKKLNNKFHVTPEGKSLIKKQALRLMRLERPTLRQMLYLRRCFVILTLPVNDNLNS